MSIQSQFRKKGLATSKKKTVKDLVASNDQTESTEYLTSYQQLKEIYYPPADYTNLDNISRYGSSQGVYELAITKIYEEYPYDGTLAEKTDWQFKNSFLERHVFENEYPRYNGHITLSANGWGSPAAGTTDLYGMPASVEYIDFKGGPHSMLLKENLIQPIDSFGRTKKSNQFSLETNSSSFDKMRQSNLYSSGALGNTVEFWFKKGTYDATNQTVREVIFDMWNEKTDVDYGRFRIEYSEVDNRPVFYLTYVGPSHNNSNRGTALSHGIIDCSLDYINARATSFYSSWHHVAFSVQNNGADLEIRLHVDGELAETRTAIGQAVAAIPAPHLAQIGALITNHEVEYAIFDEDPFLIVGGGNTTITLYDSGMGDGTFGTTLAIDGEVLRISDGTNTVDYTYSENCSGSSQTCAESGQCDVNTGYCNSSTKLRYGMDAAGMSPWTDDEAAAELTSKINANNSLNITAVQSNNTVVLTPGTGATITITEDPAGNGQIGSAGLITVSGGGAPDPSTGIFGTFAITDTSKTTWVAPEQKRNNSLGLENDASTPASPQTRKEIDPNALYVDAVLVDQAASNPAPEVRQAKIDFTERSFPNLTQGKTYKMIFEIKNNLGVVLKKIESAAYTF